MMVSVLVSTMMCPTSMMGAWAMMQFGMESGVMWAGFVVADVGDMSGLLGLVVAEDYGGAWGGAGEM